MAQYNSTKFTTALESVSDALNGLPEDVIPTVTQEMLTYWTTHQLDKTYPEFIEIFGKIDDLMML